MKKMIFAGLLTWLALGQIAMAQGLRLGEPITGGTGCPVGSVGTVLSPEQSTLTILFDSYVAEAGRDVRKTVDRKNCNLTIPMKIPQGYSLSIIQVDYRGYTYVSSRSDSVRFTTNYYFANQRGISISENMYGPLDEDFLFTDRLALEALVWSACGADTNLTIGTSLQANSRSGRQVLASLDSVDVGSELIYHLQWRRCR